MNIKEKVNHRGTVMANICTGETFIFNGALYMCIEDAMRWDSTEEEWNVEANALCLSSGVLDYICLSDTVYPVESSLEYSYTD